MYDIIFINMKGEWRCVTRIPSNENEVDWFVKCVDEISNSFGYSTDCARSSATFVLSSHSDSWMALMKHERQVFIFNGEFHYCAPESRSRELLRGQRWSDGSAIVWHEGTRYYWFDRVM